MGRYDPTTHPTDMALEPGTTLGPYKVIAKIRWIGP